MSQTNEFEPVNHEEQREADTRKKSSRNIYVDNTLYKVGNIFVLIWGILCTISAIVLFTNASINGGYIAGGLIDLGFAIWMIVEAAIQMNPAKANKTHEIIVLVLACLSLNIVSIILIAIAMANENKNA